jgi:hypothetical protein
MRCDTFPAYPINSMDKLQYGRAHRHPPARLDGAADRGARATRLPSFRAAGEPTLRALRARGGPGDRGGRTECRRLPARRARPRRDQPRGRLPVVPDGVESLPRRGAELLLEAYEQGVAQLPPCFEAWGAIALEEAGPEDVGGVLDAGFVGVSLPAGALPGPREVEHLGARVLPAPLADGRLRGARGRRACPPLGLVCRGAVPALAAQRLTRVPLADGRSRPRRRSRGCCPCAE